MSNSKPLKECPICEEQTYTDMCLECNYELDETCITLDEKVVVPVVFKPSIRALNYHSGASFSEQIIPQQLREVDICETFNYILQKPYHINPSHIHNKYDECIGKDPYCGARIPEFADSFSKLSALFYVRLNKRFKDFNFNTGMIHFPDYFTAKDKIIIEAIQVRHATDSTGKRIIKLHFIEELSAPYKKIVYEPYVPIIVPIHEEEILTVADINKPIKSLTFLSRYGNRSYIDPAKLVEDEKNILAQKKYSARARLLITSKNINKLKSESCFICLLDFEVDDESFKLKCDHLLHTACYNTRRENYHSIKCYCGISTANTKC